MNPEEQVRWCFYSVIRTLFRVIFIDITKKKFTINLGYFLWILMYTCAFFALLYTASHYETDVAVNAVTILIDLLHMLVKYSCLHDIRGLVDIADFLIAIYRKNLNACDEYTLFGYYANIGKWMMSALLGAIGLVASTFISFPVIWYFLTGTRITPLPVYFPYLDETTNVGFLILTLYHSILVMFALSVTGAIDSTVMIVFINVLMMAEKFGNHVRKQNLHLLDEKRNRAQQKRQLIYLIREYKEFSKYVNKIEMNCLMEYLLYHTLIIYCSDCRLISQLKESSFNIFFCQISLAICAVVLSLYQVLEVR